MSSKIEMMLPETLSQAPRGVSLRSAQRPFRCSLLVIERQRRAAFTLVEMLVALSILIILMAAVGEIFSLAGRTVRVGQATLAAMSSIRAVEAQIAHDVKHLDTNGFLVIRQRYYAPQWMAGVQYEPGDEVYVEASSSSSKYYLCQQANTSAPGTTSSEPLTAAPYTNATWQNLTGAIGQYPIWRADQIGFMETGVFQGRTGSTQFGKTSMVDNLTSNKALVWFGQLTASYGAAALNYKTGSATAAPNPGNLTQLQDAEVPFWRQSSWVPLGMPPSGQTSGEFYFGREAILLVPNGLSQVVVNGLPPSPSTLNSYVYNNPFYNSLYSLNSGNLTYRFAPVGESFRPQISSSRLDAAYDAIPAGVVRVHGYTPGSTASYASPSGVGTIEGYLDSLPRTAANIAGLADFFCYRYSTLVTPGASENAATPIIQMLNGYFRMAPIMLQGVPSFSVDWTDGVQSTFSGTNNGQGVSANALNWYGLDGNTGSPSPPYPSPANTNGPYLPTGLNNANTPVLVQGNSNAAALNPVYVFYAGNRPYWPKALKLTYAVTDPNNRLQGGRFVTQVVELPQ